MIEIPPPSQSTALIGHDKALTDVQAAYDSGRMHHAWLVTGAEGIGKASLAYHIAHLVLSGGENRLGKINPQSHAAKLVMAESHPDLFILRRPADEKTGVLKESIPVETARGMVPFFRLTSAHGHGRVAIIDEAHALNRHGQNAILKIIEEPPAGAVIVLTATTVGSLLPTIRSRVRLLALDPLTPAALETVLTRLGVDMPAGAAKQSLLTHAGGSAGRAIQLMQTETLPLLDALVALVAAPALDVVALHALADQIGRKSDAETFTVLTTLFTEFLRASIVAAAKGAGDPTGIVTRMTGGGRLDQALDLWEKTKNTFALAKTANLDNKLAFINAVTEISRL